MNQKTIDRVIEFDGTGLHSGVTVHIKLLPAKANTGIIFRRVDLKENNEIKVAYSNVKNTRLGTTIINSNGASVLTIEHFMAALWACDIDNLIIEIDNKEVPILDGTAGAFVDKIKKGGIKDLGVKRKILKVLKEVSVVEEGKKISIKPCDCFSIDMNVEYKYGNIGKQGLEFSEKQKESFSKTVGKARTFCYKNEIETMRKMGLAKGGSLDNAMVFDDEGIINESGLRMENEVVSHKVIDCIGDMFTSGYFMQGKIEADKTGHTLNNKLLRKLFESKENYEII